MAGPERGSPERPRLEIRWDRRALRRNTAFLTLFLLAYIALAVLAPGLLGVIGKAGVVVSGFVLLVGRVNAWRVRRRPVAAILDEAGVSFSFGRRRAAAWDTLREVRLESAGRGLLLALRPLQVIAFVPNAATDVPPRTFRERQAARIYGTSLLLAPRTVTPDADSILAAVQRLSDVPIRR